MADTKISDLAAVTDVLATDEYVLARSGATKKIDASNLLAEVSDAANIDFTPAGTISSTNVQDAIEEVASEAGGGSGLFDAYAYYRDQQTAGTNGGTLSSGSFVKMPLNTEVFDTATLGTLSSSQVTLQAGTYLLEASSPGVLDGSSADSSAVLKIRDVTNSADVAIGTPMTVWAVSGSSADGAVVTARGRVTIASATVFEVQKRVSTTMTTYGWGRAANLGVTEVYGQLMVYREA